MSAKAMETPLLEGSNPEFQSLEEKIARTIEMLKAAREAKTVAERETQRLRKQLNDHDEEFDKLRAEVVSLRKEREEVKSRIERMLGRIDELAAEEAAD
jgi:septal ring factor EnvC (AmiA/AmiB activator)